MSRTLRGRAIKEGRAEGVALVSPEPIGFFGGVDPETGVVREKGHPLEGESIAGRVLVFPRGKGSTVGSYVIYALARNGVAPVGMVLEDCEPIVALGAIMADIPVVDGVNTEGIRTGDRIRIEGDRVTIG
ncbi:MAG: DUF126 domain-containing protein [Anaerolineae bacterium]|nr:DUF126 domain-containing protein [Anaerolineae bacterium]